MAITGGPVSEFNDVWVALRNRMEAIAMRYHLHGDSEAVQDLRRDLFDWLRRELRHNPNPQRKRKESTDG